MPCRSSGKVRMTPSIWALSFSKVPGCTGNFSLSAWVCSKEHSETKMLHSTGWRCSRCKIPGASAGITNKHSHVCCVSKSKVKEGGIQGREKFFIFFYFYFYFLIWWTLSWRSSARERRWPLTCHPPGRVQAASSACILFWPFALCVLQFQTQLKLYRE